MRVRHATLDDLRGSSRGPRPVWLAKAIRDLTGTADVHSSRVLVAEEDGRLRAVLGLRMERGCGGGIERAVVEVLTVDPEHFGRGIGSLLVRFAEGIARIHGCGRVDVANGLEGWGKGRCWSGLGYRGGDDGLAKELGSVACWRPA